MIASLRGILWEGLVHANEHVHELGAPPVASRYIRSHASSKPKLKFTKVHVHAVCTRIFRMHKYANACIVMTYYSDFYYCQTYCVENVTEKNNYTHNINMVHNVLFFLAQCQL